MEKRLLNRRLLVLDDEPGILDAYRFILSPPPAAAPAIVSSRSSAAKAVVAPAVAFDVIYASNGLEALRHIEQGLTEGHPFAGGFFDVKLGPGIDGIETIRRAKEMDPNLLCVMVTAYQDRSIDEITKIFGEDYADRWDFLTKPFSHNEILQKARNLISNWDRRHREKEYLEQIQNQQEMLIRQERLAAMGTMARGIGHEFSNILLAIIGKAHIARQKADPAEMADALKVIAASAERAGVITRNLQSLVKMEPKRELGDIQRPIIESLELIDHELRKSGIVLTKDFAQGLPEVSMNGVEIGQVFLNLFINAIHAMENSSAKELKVRTQRDKEGIYIEVVDTGCGIAPENLEKIFEPLFTTKGERGSGIGLSVSKKIVENHNGRLRVLSQVGRGTTFLISLPLANP